MGQASAPWVVQALWPRLCLSDTLAHSGVGFHLKYSSKTKRTWGGDSRGHHGKCMG